MKLRTPVIVPIVLGIFLLGIAGSIMFNLWATSATKNAAEITKPADIKGSMAFSLIGQAFGIPTADLLEAFAVKDKQDMLCKELEGLYADIQGGEIGTDSVRYFVSLYTGLPHTPGESTKLPLEAYGILEKKLAPDKLVPLKDMFINVSGSMDLIAPATPAPAQTPPSTDRVIKGSTTFNDLISWGVTKGGIESVTGKPVIDPTATVKSVADASGVEFSTWKTPLQAIVDSKK